MRSFFVRAHTTGEPKIIAAVACDVVLADMLFTLTAVVLQPVTGLWLAAHTGYPLSTPWIQWSIGLYVLVGCSWLPVVWLQVRMRELAANAAAAGLPLAESYWRYYRWWFALGWPAFIGVIVIFYLMVAKPGI